MADQGKGQGLNPGGPNLYQKTQFFGNRPYHPQPTSQKALGAAGIGTPVMLLTSWGLKSAGIEAPPEVLASMGVLLASAISWLVPN